MQKVPDMIKAVSHLLVGLVQVISVALVSTTTPTVELIVPILYKNDEYNIRELVKPTHLTHELKQKTVNGKAQLEEGMLFVCEIIIQT